MIKITAIVPNYNSSALLPHALNSLLLQTDAFDEIIVVDDGSTDASVALIQTFLHQHPHLSLIQLPQNQGVAAALNAGIQQARGDYILLCAADDLYHRQSVQRVKQILQKNPNVGLVCGDALVTHFSTNKTVRKILPYPPDSYFSSEDLKKYAASHHVGFNGAGSMFINRAAILRAGALDPGAKWHCDWILYWVIAFEQGIYYAASIFVHIHLRAASYSEARHHWATQKPVMIHTFLKIKRDYPQVWPAFKKAALLPYYSLRCLPLFLLHRDLRSYITIRMLWKHLINSPLIIRLSHLFPYRFTLAIRKLLRA